jgi:hypothetical protein
MNPLATQGIGAVLNAGGMGLPPASAMPPPAPAWNATQGGGGMGGDILSWLRAHFGQAPSY